MIIKDVVELKVKEINCIDMVVNELIKMGVNIEVMEDGMIIYGGVKFYGVNVNSYGDYCIGMMFVVVFCIVEGEIIIENCDVVFVFYL